ncbi:MAG: GntR family transcriptional regulator [Tissierellia bacterium]|nr:GntR family transcriptional regulator [Tissierellia bacterium]
MHIVLRNSSDKPIYEQIKEQIQREIMSGSLKPGEQLPSIRYLAKELRISVVTTKRAYDDLERDGFIHSVQGKGSFVAEENAEWKREEYLRKIETALKEALHIGRLAGLGHGEIAEILELLEADDE